MRRSRDAGPTFRAGRKARGYSQEIVAQRLCTLSESNTVTRQIVSRWERQERVPSEYWLLNIADVLSVPIDLLRGTCAAVAVSNSPTPAVPTGNATGAGSPCTTAQPRP